MWRTRAIVALCAAAVACQSRSAQAAGLSEQVTVREDDEFFGPLDGGGGGGGRLVGNATGRSGYIQFGYFHRYEDDINSAGLEGSRNLGCQLNATGHGALFMTLTETGDDENSCMPMPKIPSDAYVDAAGRPFAGLYYSLNIAAIDPNNPRTSYNVTSFNAFCSEGCGDCQIVWTDPLHDGDSDAVIEYDVCLATAEPIFNSYFVREGMPGTANGCQSDDEAAPDVCMLTHHRHLDRDGITELRYSQASGCNHCSPKTGQGTAVVAMALREVRLKDCDRGGDNTSYKFTRQLPQADGGGYEGWVNCKTGGCETDSCELFHAKLGECGGGTDFSRAGDVKFFQTQYTGLSIDSKPHIARCAGLPPVPTPKPPPPPTPTPPSPHTPSKVAHPYRMTVVIMSSVILGMSVAYLAFCMLRRQKLKRMSAYAALQDDPTF